jgi:hypothetical protein
MNDAFQVQRSVESMPEELRETELSCNPELRNAYAALLYPHEMAAEKKNAVTAYVLARIAELDATYGAVAEALRRGGLPRNAASRLRSGGDVAGITPAREAAWARALGLPSVEALHAAAFLHEQASTARPLTEAHREAIAQARPLGQMTEADAERIIRAAPQFWDRPAEWWLSHLLAEYRYVREVRAREEREERERAAYHAKVRAERRKAAAPAPAPPVAPRRRGVG